MSKERTVVGKKRLILIYLINIIYSCTLAERESVIRKIGV